MYPDDSKHDCFHNRPFWVDEMLEKRAELEFQEAMRAATQACIEKNAAEEAEQFAWKLVEEESIDFLGLHEEKKWELEDASLKFKEAIRRCAKAELDLEIIRLDLESKRRSNDALSAIAHEEVDIEVTGTEDDIEEEVVEEVEQITMANTIIEPLEGDMVIVEEEVQFEKVVQEEGHLVEPEIKEFIFAPDDYELYEKARLLEFLPKIFSFGKRFRSRRYTTPCHTLSRRAPPLAYKPEPTLCRDYTHVRGWSINDLKWPWQFKVNMVFEWRFGLGVFRQRSYPSLSVWK